MELVAALTKAGHIRDDGEYGPAWRTIRDALEVMYLGDRAPKRSR